MWPTAIAGFNGGENQGLLRSLKDCLLISAGDLTLLLTVSATSDCDSQLAITRPLVLLIMNNHRFKITTEHVCTSPIRNPSQSIMNKKFTINSEYFYDYQLK